MVKVRMKEREALKADRGDRLVGKPYHVWLVPNRGSVRRLGHHHQCTYWEYNSTSLTSRKLLTFMHWKKGYISMAQDLGLKRNRKCVVGDAG